MKTIAENANDFASIRTDCDWKVHPIIHLDFSRCSARTHACGRHYRTITDVYLDGDGNPVFMMLDSNQDNQVYEMSAGVVVGMDGVINVLAFPSEPQVEPQNDPNADVNAAQEQDAADAKESHRHGVC